MGTYIWVESAENTAAEIAKAGGSVVMEPFPSLDSGRIAVVADPAWAVFGVWQPGEDRGARRRGATALERRLWGDDVDGTAEWVAQLGGEVVAPPYDIPGAALRQAFWPTRRAPRSP